MKIMRVVELFRRAVSVGRRGVVAAMAILVTTVSCVETDIFVGNEILPPGFEMGTYIDSTMGVRTSIIALDSFVTSNVGLVYVGDYKDDIFGRVTTEAMSTFMSPTNSGTSAEIFGTNAILDSMKVSFYFVAPLGDSNSKITISLHQIKDTTLSFFNNYYSTFDMEKYYDDLPLAQFDVTGEDTIVTVHLPESFYSQFVGFEPAPDTVFIDKFKGFYFKLHDKPLSPSESGVMYLLSLASSGMSLYFHNKDIEADTIIKSTTSFLFYDERAYSGNNFTSVKHDYSYADPSKGGVDKNQIGDATLNVDRLFVQGMGGLGARVELDTLHIDKIKAEAVAKGYKHVALQKVYIRWNVESHTADTYDDAPSRLGLYHNFYTQSLIKDYDLRGEMSSPGFISDIDGYLNRSNGYYEQVITAAMQSLFSKPSDVPYSSLESYEYVLQLLPAWNEIYSSGAVVINGSGSSTNAPKMLIVYTLVK